jgi:ribosome biogenesis GTPase
MTTHERDTQESGRVIEQDRDRWLVQLESGPTPARTPTSFAGPYPVTGDWVVVEPGPMPVDPVTIVGVLPRKSAISRGAAGSGATEQVLAANIDTVWIVHGMDTPPNLRRLERYLAVAWESGAVPEVVLTKADLAPDPVAFVAEIEAIALGVIVHVVSVEQPSTVEKLRAGLTPGSTTALLGPSGAGKSTLVNALSETEVTETGPVRARDHKGRHTTTRRQLFQIPGGAFLLDTPGLRELRVWDLGEGLTRVFPEIDELAQSCRFRDCQHESEPGCAVLAAAASGELLPERLESFRKLRAEAAHAQRKMDPEARAAAVAQHKTAMKTLKFHPKYRDNT